ncbi:MAG TPA: DNA repair protein RecN [Burkholderiales bacterium]|nr:DNA repair protein RecN [Burkholderiales bacterium]
MLAALTIRDFVIVERIELEFAAGFTALTGETGAGKSILIDALALALGERGDAAVVRQGADKAEISAEFDIADSKPLRQWLTDNDLADGEQCLLRRVIDGGGRSRAFINGRACTLQQLREAGEYLVDIHGQHEHQSLLRAAAQRALLDAYAGNEELATAVAGKWRRGQELRQQLAALETNVDAIAAEREQLEWQVRDIEALNFTLEAWHETQADHARLAHGQSLIEGAQYALDALSESEGAIGSQLAGIESRLNQLLDYDARLKEIVDLVASAQAQAQEAVYMLRDYQERLDIDPQRFREIEQRLDAVHAMARKWRVTPETLPDALARAQQRLAELGGGADIETLRKRAAEANEAYLAEAKKLTAARKKAAKKLSEKVTEAMQTLAMAGGSFDIALHPLDEGNSSGLEQIEFRVAAHKSTEPRPLAKVASGGELSRISLALQTVTSEVAPVPTLIFDEVDSGIGGGVAEIVGRMLKKLGAKRQVMCVTHLPQVAASADQQWQVAKSAANGKVSSSVTVLDGRQRVEEIARMLGGVKITETTRKHAAEMLGLD